MPNRQNQPHPEPLAQRGVYTLPYVGKDGERYLVAIGHHGQRLAEATLYPGVRDAAPIVAMLEELLERDDPIHLALVP